MPSPIAHAGLILAVRPLAADTWNRLPPWRRYAFYAAVLFALLAPDMDFVFSVVFGENYAQHHGTFTHSLLGGAVFGFGFAMATRWLTGFRFGRLWLLGSGCHWAHLFMDALTEGRGVAFLWPFYESRIRSPWPLFVGLHHSQPSNWKLHLMTLANETAFLLLVWLLSRWWSRRSVG